MIVFYQKTESTKYLGLIIDDKLSWVIHIQKIIKKIVPMTYLNNVNRTLTDNAYIVSYLIYLVNNWGTCGSTNFKKA